MTEIKAQAEVKKELSPEQILQRNILAMPNKQMSRRLKRLTRTNGSNIDNAFAVVLSIVFDNTKPMGKMEPFLR